MSKIGSINNSYGSQFNVSIANTYSYIILSGNNLPSNSFIISSNVNEDNEDTGSYSILMTDYQGNPVRLTYTIQEGNGLSFENDVLKIKTDTTFVNNSAYNLTVDINSLIDDNTLKYDGLLRVNIDNLSKISSDNLGLIKVDGKTITSDEGKIFIQTQNLEYANDDSNIHGIFTSDDESLSIVNGIVSVNNTALRKCSENEFGICKCDEITLYIKNGIHVNTENLNRSSKDNFGIIKGSDTIDINNGIIKVNENLPITTTTTNGILSFDGNTIIKNNNDQLTVKDYNNFLTKLSDIEDETNKINNSLKTIKQNILSSISS